MDFFLVAGAGRVGEILGLLNVTVDATGRLRAEAALRESEAWLAGQKEAFQAAVTGEPLEISLGILSRVVTEQMGSVRCAFYAVNSDCTELHHLAGMPASYAECVDGFKVGTESLACGLAVATAAPVITRDVRTEPRWTPWVWLAEKYHFRAVWSYPIETSSGTVVGTMALYFPAPSDGIQIVRTMADQLKGTVHYRQSGGTVVEVRFPAKAGQR